MADAQRIQALRIKHADFTGSLRGLNAKALRERKPALAAEIRKLSDTVNGREDKQFNDAEAASWDAMNEQYDLLEAAVTDASNPLAAVNHRSRLEEIEQGLRQPAASNPPGIGRADYTPPPVNRHQRHEVNEEQRALAIHAWFLSNSSREWRLSDEHREACEATGLNPNAKELVIRLNPSHRVKAVQAAFASGTSPVDRQYRAQQALRYGAALGTGPSVAGGAIAAPETMASAIEINMLSYSGMLQVAEIMRTDDRARMRWPTADDTSNSGRRLGENAAVTTLDPTFGEIFWDVYKYTSDEIKVPFELLNGTPFDLPGILGSMMGERIGRKLNTDFTTGTGSNQPKGLITAASSYSAPSATAIAWDDLESLIGAVDPAYRTGAGFMFHDAIRQYLKKLKDGQGRPLWQDGPNGAEPATIKGYPWTINQAMDSTVASGKKTVAFGRLPNYKVRQVGAIRIYRLTERYRENDQDAFLAFQEADGNLVTAGTAPVKYLSH